MADITVYEYFQMHSVFQWYFDQKRVNSIAGKQKSVMILKPTWFQVVSVIKCETLCTTS